MTVFITNLSGSKHPDMLHERHHKPVNLEQNAKLTTCNMPQQFQRSIQAVTSHVRFEDKATGTFRT
jgi:hypothetical protein